MSFNEPGLNMRAGSGDGRNIVKLEMKLNFMEETCCQLLSIEFPARAYDYSIDSIVT